MILPLLDYDDPQLKLPAHLVDDPLKLIEFVENLRQTLLAQPTALGLAAPQVGVSVAVFALKVGSQVSIIVNPQVIWTSETLTAQCEGCLSFPMTSVPVTRPSKIKVTYQDELGHPHDEDLEGLVARVWLHEFDHCCGVTILDKVPPDQQAKILAAQARQRRRRQARASS